MISPKEVRRRIWLLLNRFAKKPTGFLEAPFQQCWISCSFSKNERLKTKKTTWLWRRSRARQLFGTMKRTRHGMKFRSGEIVLLPFPFSDHSARKKRPVLVLSQPDARGDFASLAITSKTTHEKAFALVPEHLYHGHLPKPSWIRFDKVYTVNTFLTVGTFGSLRPEITETVHALFCDHFLCERAKSS